MALIVRNRTLRPSTRLASSKSYKIDTKAVSSEDILIVNIDHESFPFKRAYKFRGADVDAKISISFRVRELGNDIDIAWRGAEPIGDTGPVKESPPKKRTFYPGSTAKNSNKSYDLIDIKTSFEPISDSETAVLILGTMPGDKSIELGEYYGHPRNRFWRIISTVINAELPMGYLERRRLLLDAKIGIWDVAHKVNRPGSLDSSIRSETPNDLDGFISRHKNLKVIGFNGKKAEALYDKYFKRTKNIRYIALPSSSPANTNITFENLCNSWRQILLFRLP